MDSGIERVEDLVEAARRPSGRGPVRLRGNRLRGCVFGCAGFLVVLLIALLVLNHYAGSIIIRLVKERAGDSINGRIEIGELKPDWTGRAVLRDVVVYPRGADGKISSEALLRAPTITVTTDLVNLFGPNRGRKAVVINVDQPELTLVRQEDGSFNVNKLIKPRPEEKGGWGVAINLKDAAIDFTDLSLLDQVFPQLSMPDGSLGAKLLAEAGYRKTPGAEQAIHHEKLLVNGSIAINPERHETAIKLEAERTAPGGKLSVDGTVLNGGSDYELTLGLTKVDPLSIKAYVQALLPQLHLQDSSLPWPATAPEPSFGGLIDSAKLKLGKVAGKEGSLDFEARLTDAHYRSKFLPELSLPLLAADYKDHERLGVDLQLEALGAKLSGKPSLRWDEKDPTLYWLDGRLDLKAADIAPLRGELARWLGDKKILPAKASGALDARLDLGGSTNQPDLKVQLSGEKLAWDKFSAGQLKATGGYSGPPGMPALEFDIDAGKLDLAGLTLGKLSAKGNYSGPPGGQSGQATLGSSDMKFGSLDLGKLSAKVGIAKGVATLSEAKLSGGEAPLTASGTLNLKTHNGKLKASVGPLEAGQLFALANKAQTLGSKGKGKKAVAAPDSLKDLKGKLTASADLTITKGKPDGSLVLSSDKLVYAKQTFTNFSAKGGLKGNTINIDAAEAKVTLAEAVTLAGFSSTGPLSLSARAGGTITLPAKGKPAGTAPVLALSGKASTSNLKPEQANIAFKLSGPLDGGELKLQLKTTAKQNPLNLSGKLKLAKGMAPAEASLSWYDSKVDYKGKLDLAAQKLDGKLSADKLDLARFMSGSPVSGSLSAAAQISGSFSAPSLSGKLTSPALSYATDKRNYDVTKLSAGFKLVSKGKAAKGKPAEMQLSVSDGSFNFEGMPFTASGVLGREGSELTLASSEFNLFSVLALVPDSGSTAKRPEIHASGPLNIVFTGTPADPKVKVSYQSGAGSVDKHKFTSAVLKLEANKTRLDLSNFEIKSPQGSIQASGTAAYTLPDFGAPGTGKTPAKKPAGGAPAKPSGDSNEVHLGSKPPVKKTAPAKAEEPKASAPAPKPKPKPQQPDENSDGDSTQVGWLGIKTAHAATSKAKGGFVLHSFQAQVVVDSFDVGVLTPLSGQEILSELSGTLAGSFMVTGTPSAVDGEGDLKLTAGKFHGIPIQSASATLKTQRLDDGRLQLLLSKGKIVSDKTQLTASGKLGPTPADSTVDLHADSLDLALLAPFIPDGTPKPSGVLQLDLTVAPGKGAYPRLKLDAKDNGDGVRVSDKAKFDAVSIKAQLQDDILDVTTLSIKSGSSSVTAGGKISPALLTQGASGMGNVPLDFWVKSSDFNFADAASLAAPLMTKEQLALVPSGTISANLTLKGTAKEPEVLGLASFALTKLPGEMALKVSGVSGTLSFIPNGGFELKNVRLSTGSDPALAAALISGGGEYSFKAPFIKSGTLTVNLSPEDKYIPFEYDDTFAGTLGGKVTIIGKPVAGTKNQFQLVVSEGLSVTSKGEKSTFTYNPPPKGAQTKVNRNVRFSNFNVLIQPGTQFRFTPPSAASKLALSDMQLGLDGALMVNGIPGLFDKNDPDAFSVKGEIEIPNGSLLVYKYKLKLDGLQNKLTFTGKPGDIYPEFTGRGALTLPRVLKGYDPGISLPGDSIDVGGPKTGGGGSRSQDLEIFFNFDHVKLDPASPGLGKFTLTSNPPMAAEKIQGYLLGGVQDVLTGQTGLGDFAEGELVGFGSSFISRQIERGLGLESFYLGGSGSTENPYFVDVEKAVTPELSLTYYKNFFTQTNQDEEFGVRYKLFEQQFGDRYSGLQLKVDFQNNGLAGTGSTVQFEYTVRF